MSIFIHTSDFYKYSQNSNLRFMDICPFKAFDIHCPNY